MVPDAFREFFTAIAAAGGALVGLLFVAVSVAPEPVVGPRASTEQQVRASAALLALLSPLVLALVALIPDSNVGYGSAAYGCVGVLFAAASARRLLGVDGARRRLHSARQVLGFAVVMGLEVYAGVRLIAAPGDAGALNYIAGSMIGSLAIGIDRAWELVGARRSNFGASMRDLLGLDVAAPTPVAQAPAAEPGDAPLGSGHG